MYGAEERLFLLLGGRRINLASLSDLGAGLGCVQHLLILCDFIEGQRYFQLM